MGEKMRNMGQCWS